MAIPPRGSCWSSWNRNLVLEDFTYLHDDLGNGRNLTALSRNWFALLGDSPVDRDKPYSVCSGFYAKLSDPAALPQIVLEYAGLGYRLLQGLRLEEGKLCYEPLYRDFAKTPIFREFYAWVRCRYTNDGPKLLRWMMSFLWFGRKSVYKRGSDFEAKALEAWLDVECGLRERKGTFPPHVMMDLRRLFGASGFVYKREEGWPEHGPRQVAERLPELTVRQKNGQLRLNASVREYYARFAVSQIDAGRARLVDLILPDLPLNLRESSSAEIAQQAFVPSDVKKVRTICMEPLCNMWGQQSVLKACLSALNRVSKVPGRKSRPLCKLSRIIDLDDQGKNRISAILGSLFGNYATLDLSRASDSVPWELIEFIVMGDLAQDMDDVRTDLVKILKTDIVVRVLKFAPMGSALCMIWQSILFALFIALAHVILRKGLDFKTYLSEGMEIVSDFPAIDENVRVYGDDIIVEERHVPLMMSLLELFGFEPNRDKSFTGSQAVRESCGIFAIQGADFTPLLFKVKGLEYDNHESWFGALAMANAARDLGYYNLRNSLLELVPEECYVRIGSDSFYANQAVAVMETPGTVVALRHKRVWSRAQSTELKPDRYNDELKRWERYIFTVVTDLHGHYGEFGDPNSTDAPLAGSEDPLHDDLERYYYGKWIYKPFRGVGTPHNPDRRPSPRNGLSSAVRVGWRWTPISEG